MTYDIIGDIHGYADELRFLLAKLGYRELNGGYSRRDHQAVFVGDFVDRGPKIKETLSIVRSMVDRGSAQAVLGNHEFNAICYHTEDGHGDFLRSHVAGDRKNARQHEETLKQLAEPFPKEWQEWLNWFKGLPLFLERDGLRVVHAAWDPAAMRIVRGRSFHNEDFLRKSAKKGTEEFAAVETLLKGPEVPFPTDFEGTPDKEGHIRRTMRIAWWKPRKSGRAYSYSDLALLAQQDGVPSIPIPPDYLAECPSYGPRQLPVFFGHYWLIPQPPEPLAPNAACVDYSVANPGGQLTAYSWAGENRLLRERFTFVARDTV